MRLWKPIYTLQNFFFLIFLLLISCNTNSGLNEQAKWDLFENPPQLVHPKPIGSVEYQRPAENLAVNLEVLRSGQRTYGIYCAICHGSLGRGNGRIINHGFQIYPTNLLNLKSKRLSIFDVANVIRDGKGAMLGMSSQLNNKEIWSTSHYVKALQLSDRFPISELNSEQRQQLQVKSEE